MRNVTTADIRDYIGQVARSFPDRGRIYLIGATSHAWEGFLPHVGEVELTIGVGAIPGDGAPERLRSALLEAANERGIQLNLDSPADYIPLPDGFEERSIPASNPPRELGDRIELRHFDPYSVALRFIARGDEPDYHVALMSLSRGWMTDDGLDDMLTELLPRFTKETIQQDPAEFRRKYKGLLQLRKSTRPGLMHRFSPV